MRYKVRFMMDDNYEVIELTENENFNEHDYEAEADYYDVDEFNEESVHQGSLANCEAYIRLHEGGYM